MNTVREDKAGQGFSAPVRSRDRHLILASTSPRRAQLLRSAGLPFTLASVSFEEPAPTAEDERAPACYVERLAQAKAATCDLTTVGVGPLPAPAGAIVLTADTIVWHEGRILNKPRDEAEACTMLRTLRGQTHQVLTGVCLRIGDDYRVEHEVTQVKFFHMTDQWIDRYVATGEPMDKAGAYAAQGLGAFIIERVEGDFTNVVGLPLGRLGRMLEAIGAPSEMWWE